MRICGWGGWINSTPFADQVAPLMHGQPIRMPVRPGTVIRAIPRQIHLGSDP
jgi:hypothetical protein